jgi:FdhD protein
VSDESELVTEVGVVRLRGLERTQDSDCLVVEEPLELQVNGVSLSVTMRTPGHDEELALGFLLTEGIVERASDVASVRHCTEVTAPEAEGNLLRVVLREGVAPPLEQLRRHVFASSSCGICGKATIEQALRRIPRVQSAFAIEVERLYDLPDRLRGAQEAFTRTGGLHAAALFDARGELGLVREDVGRHNAVDKIAGALARGGLDPSAHGLLVSGRVGFEIVQKAAAIGIPLVAGISAPSSLAVRYGDALGLTVVGFLRGRSLNAYAHAERLLGAYG